MHDGLGSRRVVYGPEHHSLLKAADTAVSPCRQCQHPVPTVAYGHHPLSTIWQKDRSLLQPLDLTSPTTFQVHFCYKSAHSTPALSASAAAADPWQVSAHLKLLILKLDSSGSVVESDSMQTLTVHDLHDTVSGHKCGNAEAAAASLPIICGPSSLLVLPAGAAELCRRAGLPERSPPRRLWQAAAPHAQGGASR